jgi:hypothetical protein
MYDALPNATSIRVLDLLEASPAGIRCNMHVVDVDSNPAYAAVSYTSRNPITVHERTLSDPVVLDHLEADDFAFPFDHLVSRPPTSNGTVEVFATVDGARREYYQQTLEYCQNMPCEHVDSDDSTPFIITVNGCAVRVGKNLAHFLVSLGELRTRMLEETLESPELLKARDALRLPLWIDAICVNQNDLDEKAASVKLARTVVKSALHVFAWVGASDRLGDLALEAVSIILDYMHSQALRDGDRLGIALDRPLPAMFTLSSIIEMTAAHWFALFSFFQRTWFRKAWAALEFILAQQAYIIYGENMLDMSLVYRVLLFLDERGLSEEFSEFGRAFLAGEPVSDPAKHLTKLLVAAKLKKGRPSPAGSDTKALVVEPKGIFTFIRGFRYIRLRTRLRLTSVISALRDLDTADPRDKIFAFLGLANNDLGIVPDYGATVQDVYRTATVAMMKERNLLSILSQVQDAQNTKIPDLPSWVPDFSARLGRVPLDRGSTSECDFRASGNALWNYKVSDGTLTVVATHVDTVSAVTDMDVDPVPRILKVALGSPARYPDKPLTWALVKTEGKTSEELRPRSVSRVEALWRTLLADNVKAEGYFPGEFADYLGNGFASWVLRDILETRVGVHALADLRSTHYWVRMLGLESFLSKVALWSAMYDGNQITTDTELSDAGDLPYSSAITKVHRRRQDERDQYHLDLHLGIPEPTVGIRHFPTANRLMECVDDPIDELDAEIVPENLSGAYRANARSRLTSEERKSAACFEERMRIVTEGRSFFCTQRGRIGLGPKSLGNDSGGKDEVWILEGADVPFILRHEEGDRYRIVGEAYVHGIMYGEKPAHPFYRRSISLI